jgi:hypothetical protein
MIAIPVHQSRVAPVLDWCSTILLIPKNQDKAWHEGQQLTMKTNIFDLLRVLSDRDVSPIICGALSPHVLCYGQHLGLEFIYGICGAIKEVVEAYQNGKLDHPRFRMPGCRWRGLLRPSTQPSPTCQGLEQGGIAMPGNAGKGGKMGRQQGKGQGGGCAGRERGAARADTGTKDVCVCPQCGREAPHTRGVPCTQLACMECGGSMIRKSRTGGTSE